MVYPRFKGRLPRHGQSQALQANIMAQRRVKEQGVVAQSVRVRAGTEEGTQQQELAIRESLVVPPGHAYHHHHHRQRTGVAGYGTAFDGADDSVPLKVRGNCLFNQQEKVGRRLRANGNKGRQIAAGRFGRFHTSSICLWRCCNDTGCPDAAL